MLPYEALYGCKCQSPLYWYNIRRRQTLGLEMIKVLTLDESRVHPRVGKRVTLITKEDIQDMK
jgi:hypothetical protein